MQENQPNYSAELLLQQVQESEKSLTAVVEQVQPRQKGKSRWNVLYFTGPDGQSGHINVWNPHLIENLNAGDLVDLDLKRNDKGFWDIEKLTKVGEQEPKSNNSGNEVAVETARSVPARPFKEHFDREHGIRSMNALTAAVTITAAMIEAKLLSPATPEEAINLVKMYHTAFLQFHNGENT